MNNTPLTLTTNPETQSATGRVPLAVKLGYTAFMAVLVPVYWANYGPTNFLYFCDIALFLTLAAVWMESALLAGMAAVGIIAPQMLWCADFVGNLAGICRALIDGGRPSDEPAAVIQEGTTPAQRTVVGTLGDLAERMATAGITPPALIVIGPAKLPELARTVRKLSGQDS
mgnify:CR=1 FL=1